MPSSGLNGGYALFCLVADVASFTGLIAANPMLDVFFCSTSLKSYLSNNSLVSSNMISTTISQYDVSWYLQHNPLI